MRWLMCGVVTALAGFGLSGCERSVDQRGGFPGETRAVFADGDPYEDQIILDWQPWSDDLFGRASNAKPILLHLGGYWCHLCHVYDRAVYGNEAFAELIRDSFTLVRVDPDERPDIDNRYNQGNWPSVCVLTPEGDLVGGSAYAPEELEQFLRAALASYVTGGDSLRVALARAREMRAVSQPFERENGVLDPTVRDRVFAAFKNHIDRDYGGFSPRGLSASKLVSADTLHSLLRELAANPGLDPDMDDFVQRTLTFMMNGAVRDHLFGGFFRSVDDRAWSRPRFAKTLEIQADVVRLYLRAASVYDRDDFRDVALETIDFAFETLSNPDSLTFANCMDSDRGPTDGGSFYTWTVEQVDALLSPREAEAIKLRFGIAPSGEIPGRDPENTLYFAFDAAASADRMGLGPVEFQGLVDRGIARMRSARLGEEHPRIDSRAYAASNLAFARALLDAADVFENAAYRDRALRLIDVFTVDYASESGAVPHYFDGRNVGSLALMRNQLAGIDALIRAHEVTGDDAYIERAQRLERHLDDAYRNEATGAYWDVPKFVSGPGFLELKLRPIRENVHVARTLMDLSVITADNSYAEKAQAVLLAFAQSFGSTGIVTIEYSIQTHRLFSAFEVVNAG